MLGDGQLCGPSSVAVWAESAWSPRGSVDKNSDSYNERPPRFFFAASLNPLVSTVADLKQSTAAGLK